MKEIIDFIAANYEWLGPAFFALLEIVLRRIPTAQSYSIINGLKLFFDTIVKNKKKDPITGEISEHK